jgi:hypothetical protein
MVEVRLRSMNDSDGKLHECGASAMHKRLLLEAALVSSEHKQHPRVCHRREGCGGYGQTSLYLS